MSNSRDIRRVGDARWPRFVIEQNGLYWDGVKLVENIRAAALYAEYRVAAKDCVMLPPEQDESNPWREGEGEW